MTLVRSHRHISSPKPLQPVLIIPHELVLADHLKRSSPVRGLHFSKTILTHPVRCQSYVEGTVKSSSCTALCCLFTRTVMFERLKCVTATGRALRLVGRGGGRGQNTSLKWRTYKLLTRAGTNRHRTVEATQRLSPTEPNQVKWLLDSNTVCGQR